MCDTVMNSIYMERFLEKPPKKKSSLSLEKKLETRSSENKEIRRTKRGYFLSLQTFDDIYNVEYRQFL